MVEQLTSKSKNVLSSPYLACTGAANLQADTSSDSEAFAQLSYNGISRLCGIST